MRANSQFFRPKYSVTLNYLVVGRHQLVKLVFGLLHCTNMANLVFVMVHNDVLK